MNAASAMDACSTNHTRRPEDPDLTNDVTLICCLRVCLPPKKHDCPEDPDLVT
jgi:hypothetical protein